MKSTVKFTCETEKKKQHTNTWGREQEWWGKSQCLYGVSHYGKFKCTFGTREGYAIDAGDPNLILEEVLQQGESSRRIQQIYYMQSTRCNKCIVMVTAVSRKKINDHFNKQKS